MKVFVLVLVSLFLFVGRATAQQTEPPQTTATDRDFLPGCWIARGPRSVTGAGMDLLLKIDFDKTSGKYRLIRAKVNYSSRNPRQSPKVQIEGPFEVTLNKDLLSFDDGKKQEFTFRKEDDVLVMPAFVESDKQTWRFKSPRQEGTFECKSDWQTTASGKASFPTVQQAGLRQSFHSVVEGSTRRIDFRDHRGNAKPHTQCSLVWDQHGSPRFEGSSWYHEFGERRFASIDQATYQKMTRSTGLNQPGGGETKGDPLTPQTRHR